MLTKPIKSLQVRWVSATVSSLDKDTFKHRAERTEEGRGQRRKRQTREKAGMKGKRDEDKENIEGVIRSDKAKDEWESCGGGDKMVGQKEQVDKDVIMINQQHVYTISPPPPSLSLCIISFL